MLTRGQDIAAARDKRPFRRRGLLVRTATFAAATALAFALYPFGGPSYGLAFALAVVLAVTFLPLVIFTPWERLPAWVEVVPPLLFVAEIALLRDAHGGVFSGYAPFVLVTVIWLALYGTRSALVVGVVAVGLALVLPILLVGSPEYPGSEWRRAAAIVFVGGMAGYTIQSLVGRLFAEMNAHAETVRRLREAEAYELHDDVVQNLTVAQLALALDDRERARRSIDQALVRVQSIVARMLQSIRDGEPVRPGSLIRTTGSSAGALADAQADTTRT